MRARFLLVPLLLAACSRTGHRPVDRLAVTHDSLRLEAGATRRLFALAFDRDSFPSADDVTWATDDAGIAAVSGSGAVTAIRAGRTVITAASGRKSVRIPVTVTPYRGDTIVTVLPAESLQVMTGWEATTFAGHWACGDTGWALLKDTILDRVVFEAGINRVRLEVRSGAEHPGDTFTPFRTGRVPYAVWRGQRYDVINDNDDPNVINPAGFNFTELDFTVDNVVEPLRRRLASRGESLTVTLTLVAFQEPGYSLRRHPEDVAELFQATWQHLRDTYHWVPDGVEILLEPDVASWTPEELGAALTATVARLDRIGARPYVMAPSTTTMPNALAWFRTIVRMPGVRGRLTDVTYHRYKFSDEGTLASLGALAALGGYRTFMSERIGADHERLYDDLTAGMNSSWSQYVLAGCGPDDGGNLYRFDRVAQPVLERNRRTPYLIQYFRWVRHGAVRLEAVSNTGGVAPVAFRNRDGGMVVVVKSRGAGRFIIEGLTPGRYGVTTTTGGARTALVPAADVSAGPDGRVRVRLDGAGVLTLYAKP